MSAYSCAQLRDVAPELALGVLGGAERAEAIMHVNGCARCQALVNELSEAADALPLLAPEIEPPFGFEQRVLSSGRMRRRRSVRRFVAAVAVAAAAAAIVSVTIVRVVESGSDATRAASGVSSVAGSTAVKPIAVKMVSESDLPAGWAYVTNKRSVAIALNYGLKTGRYNISVQPRTGSTRIIGTMAIENDHGSWTGTSPVALRAGSTILLVDAEGAPSCHGTVT
jgi:hypothetical protein